MSVNSMPKENKMGTMPVKKLIFNMALPLIISMLIQALYNIVDSIFVSRISEDALTAVSLAFPVQNLMIAFATGTGVGMNALLSRRLGEKNREAAEEVANVGLLLSICTAVVFALFGVFGSQLYFSMQKGVSPIIAEYGAQYLSIVCIGSIGIFVEITAERMLQGTGQTLITMFIQGIGAIINIILDPIMIFGLLGCPAMGVRGAAYATIIGQLVAAVLGIVLNQKHNTDVRVNPKKIRFNFPLIGEIYSIGSVTTYLMNQILLAFSTTASAVYGVYFKLNSFFFMPLFGLNNAVVPIVAYNYGARNRGRIHQAIRTSTITAVTIMLLGWAAFFFLPVPLLRLFDASEAMIAIGIPAFRITSFTYPLAAVSIVASSVFQALGKSIYSMLVSLGRQLIVLIPVAYLFSLTGVLDDVWLAFPIAEVVCLISSLFFLKKVLHRLDDFPQ
jgi:putative MATE family efflux protein